MRERQSIKVAMKKIATDFIEMTTNWYTERDWSSENVGPVNVEQKYGNKLKIQNARLHFPPLQFGPHSAVSNNLYVCSFFEPYF